MTHKHAILALEVGALLLLAPAHQAYAYIDPGSGSYLFQMLLASLVGVAFALKRCWLRIKNFLKRNSRKETL